MVTLGQWNLNFLFLRKAFLKKQFILNWEAKVFKTVCIYYNECDLFIYPENASYFYFLKNSILSKNTFYPFKGRLETSLLWDLILVCERIQKSNFWASTRVSLYKAWRTDSIKTPWGNLSDCSLSSWEPVCSLSHETRGFSHLLLLCLLLPSYPSHPGRFLVLSGTQQSSAEGLSFPPILIQLIDKK